MTPSMETTSKAMKETANQISVEGARALSGALKVNTTLTTLVLRSAQRLNFKQEAAQTVPKQTDSILFTEGASALGEALKSNTALTELGLQCAQQQHDKVKHEHDIN